jgi:hypothetical protein
MGDGMTEKQIQTDILKRAGKLPWLRLWRNNVGLAVPASQIALARRERAVLYRLAMVRFGLGTGSPDLIGIIGPVGKFMAVEVKKPGEKLSLDQEVWKKVLEALGGVHVIANSWDDVWEAVRGYEP